jgi:hypothetical protein
MKKTMITMLAAIIAMTANAQINKGAWLASASSSLGFNSYSYKAGPNVSVLSTSSKGGYFFAKNFVMGTDLGYTRASSGSGTATVIVIGGFARYYLPKNIFFGAGVNSATTTMGERPTQYKYKTTTIPFELGIAAFLGKNIAVEPSIVYIKGDEKGGIVYNGLSTGATSSIGLNVAFTAYFNRN